jgi:uncharacterized protein YqfA (UPF0365 family)
VTKKKLKVNKFILFASFLWLNMINIAPAQEARPDKPPSDTIIREQVEATGSKLESSLKEQFEKALEEKENLEKKAIETGKASGKRYQMLVARFESIAQEVEQQIKEAEARKEITPATEAEITARISEMEAQLALIEQEIAAAEPGNPPQNNGKTKRSK